jgi:outer membrane beta-barrel protein
VKHTLLLLCLALPTAAFAQTDELENPGTVSAIQERAFRMNHELTLGVGSLPLDAFYKGFYAQVSYTFHFTDNFAWQVGRGGYSYNLKTGLREQLEKDFGVIPTVFEEVQYMVGSDLLWKPFYGKAAVLNSRVIYFETHLLAGATVFKFTNGFKPALNLGLGFRVFQNKVISYRLDVTDNIVFSLSQRPFNVMTIQLMLALNFGATE